MPNGYLIRIQKAENSNCFGIIQLAGKTALTKLICLFFLVTHVVYLTPESYDICSYKVVKKHFCKTNIYEVKSFSK